MFEILKNDYSLFIREDDGKKIGVLTLKNDDIYKDVDILEKEEMLFLNSFPNIESLIKENTALFVSYDKEEEVFVSSIKDKTTIGEYNDEVVWNNNFNTISKGKDFMSSLENLESSLLNINERSNSVWMI